jgi:hypothetical protein
MDGVCVGVFWFGAAMSEWAGSSSVAVLPQTCWSRLQLASPLILPPRLVVGDLPLLLGCFFFWCVCLNKCLHTSHLI